MLSHVVRVKVRHYLSMSGSHEIPHVSIRGARANNLKNISLRIPKRKITIFTGVSGSGKSSIWVPKEGTREGRWSSRELRQSYARRVATPQRGH